MFVSVLAVIAFLAFLLGAYGGTEIPRPKSDLLRNVISYAWGYDYNKLYPLAVFQPLFNPYIGFDLLTGLISKLSSPTNCVRVVQGLFLVLFLFATIKATKTLTNPWSSAASVLVVTMATLAISRMVESRPELAVTLWLLTAVFATPKQWLIVGGLVSTTYWLSPLYAVGAFLLPGTWKTRCKTFAIAAVGCTGMWLVITQGAWLKSLLLVPGMAGARIAPVPEDMPMLQALFEGGVGSVVLCLLLARTLIGTKFAALQLQLRFLGPIIFFLVVGKYRHLLVLVPLMALWSLHTKPMQLVTWRTVDWCLVPLACLCGVSGASFLSSYKNQYPEFSVPNNSYVLTSTSNSVFFLPFENPGKLKLVPSVEYASDSPESHRLTQALMSNQLTCVDIQTHGFTHVLARENVPLNLPCLKQQQTQKKWVLWSVSRLSP